MRLAIACLIVLLAGCREPMFSHLAEADANEIVAVLRQHGIEVHKVAGQEQSWALEVEADDFPRAVVVLRENGLPRAPKATIGEMFRREGLVSTPSEERIRFVFAQQQELERTLSLIDGVIAARVHVVMPHNDPLAEKAKIASASVFLKHRADVDLTPSVPQIKALVANSIEGLPHENVTLSMSPSRAAAMPVAAAVAPPLAWRAWLAPAAAAAALAAIAAAVFAWWRRAPKAAEGAARPLRAVPAGVRRDLPTRQESA